jgi:hypothetical protein
MMKSFSKLFLILLMCSAATKLTAEDFSVRLKAEQWDMPRHGETLLKQSELAKIVHRWLQQPEAIIEIRYPGGEEGELWVGELMDWLISLGIPSNAINHIPGSGAEDVINLVLIPPNGVQSK